MQNRNKNFWAERTTVSRNRERGVPLPFFSLEQGADQVKILMDEWSATTRKFGNALVVFVFGSKPRFGKMRGFNENKRGDEKMVMVSSSNDGIFLLNFSAEEKKFEVFLGGPWTFDNRPFCKMVWK